MVHVRLSLLRSLVYVFYITGGPRDLVPYIPTPTHSLSPTSGNFNPMENQVMEFGGQADNSPFILYIHI